MQACHASHDASLPSPDHCGTDTWNRLLRGCKVGDVSGGCGDQPPVPQARWRQLAATPVAQDGGPLRITPAWWPPVPDDSALAAAAVHGTPVLGEGHIINGVEMVEASFLWRDDHRHGASPSVLIHLNTLTDNHRAHIAPALAARVPGTSWWALHVLLPQDALLSYRIVVTHDALPDDAGARRECWKRVHALGRPDPLNPDRLHDGFGLVSSLWVGPKAVLHPDWMSGLGASAERTGQALSRPQDEHAGYVLRFDLENEVLRDFDGPGDPGRRVTLWCGGRVQESSCGRSERGLLVLLDGNIWRGNHAVDHLAPRSRRWDLLLIDSGSLAMRSRDLGDPRRSRDLLRRCLQAAHRAVCGRGCRIAVSSEDGAGCMWRPDRIVVAGQSLGGVAAADLVLHHPELAARAIVQSGSFWLGSQRRGEGEGELLRWLRHRSEARSLQRPRRDQHPHEGEGLGARLVVQCGVHEGGLRQGARTVSELLAVEGALLEYREERGGHDYAWWRHGLSWGLDAHEQDLGLMLMSRLRCSVCGCRRRGACCRGGSAAQIKP